MMGTVGRSAMVRRRQRMCTTRCWHQLSAPATLTFLLGYFLVGFEVSYWTRERSTEHIEYTESCSRRKHGETRFPAHHHHPDSKQTMVHSTE